MAGAVDGLFWFLAALSAALSVLIFGLLIAFAIRYRRRAPGERAGVARIPLGLELAWTFIPLGIVLAIFGWGAELFIRQLTPPPGAMTVYALGRQWMWEVQHLGGRREINELHVPTGRPVRLIMTSEDVIHSFFVPAFRVKRDVLPGRYTTLWFDAVRAGEYHLFCAEYCGTKHSAMIGRIVALPPEAFGTWLARDEGDAGQPLATAGERLFGALSCTTCHGRDDTRGPSLNGLFGRAVRLRDGSVTTADEGYLRESILQPAAKVSAGFRDEMPPYQGRLSELQVLQLIAYIQTLGAAAPP